MFRLANENLRRKSIVKLTDLKKLQNNFENMTSVVEHLTNLLANFEISKSQLSPNDRCLMREYFLNLAERYQKQKNSTQAVLLAQKLADHAYKSPECK
jgi:hypothetical protein